MIADLTRRVADIMADTLGVEVAQISETTTLDDLGADRLDLVALELALEDEFEIELSQCVTDHLTGDATPASIAAFMAREMKAGAS